MLMKKTFYLYSCIASLLFASKSNGQYYITGHNWPTYPDSMSVCNTPTIYLTTNAFTSGLQIQTYHGNGKNNVASVANGSGYGYAYCGSSYDFPGMHTIKQVLLNGSARVDSIIYRDEFLYCNSIVFKCFNDVTGTGVFDSSKDFLKMRLKIAIERNGIAYDTITSISGGYYPMVGALGDIFSFKVISVTPGIVISCPIGGIVYDTVQNPSNGHKCKYFGFHCTSTPSFDLGLYTVNSFTRGNHMATYIYAYNRSCNSTNATVTVNFGPKYVYQGQASPAPSVIATNSLSWNLSNVDFMNPQQIYYRLENSPVTGHLFMGDTVQSHYSISPVSGDLDPSDNAVIIVDSVTSSYDPNEVSVIPSGHIAAGTKLQYTITFENTGNDTAFNTNVMDTLSNNVDIKTLEILMSSHVMNLCILKKGAYNIAKFDFPNINLPDSSHHGFCDGTVIFTVNAKNGLPDGTTINNRAGIYFDYNPVVMTNSVQNIIGFPNGVIDINKVSPNIEVYPNPVSGELTVNADEHAYNTLTITNSMGQSFLSRPINTAQNKVNVKELPAGIYFLTLRGAGGVKVQKFEKL